MIRPVIRGIGKSIGNAIGIPFGGASQSWEDYWASHTPDDLSVVWENDYAKLTWTANGDKGAYEIWESINDGAYALVATTAEAATTYNNYTSQNASMKFKIRGVGGGVHSEYTSEVVLVTPLVWKTDQSTLKTVTIAELYVSATFKVYLNWGDGSALQEVTGNATNIQKNYASTGQYFIAMSGDIGECIRFVMYNQSHLYGDLSKWTITRFVARFRIYECSFSGDISDWIVPTASTLLYGNDFTGNIPQSTVAAGGAAYDLSNCKLSGSNLTIFRTAESTYNFKDQRVAFVTEEIDKLLKAMADFYEVNVPYGNLTVHLTGNYMGVPTGGNSNVDKVRTEGYYTAAGKTATINVNAPVPFDSPKLMITFDGNISSIYTEAFPVLVNKGVKATMYSWANGVTGTDGSYSWANCVTMAAAGMDIQDHSVDHVRMTEKTEAQLIADFEAVNAAFIANGLPAPNHIAYPFGSSNALVESVTATYRMTGRKYTPDVWLIWKNLIKLAVPCYTIDGVDIEAIKDVLDSAIAGNALVVTLNHSGNASQLAAMIDYALAGGMDIITVSEMYALL